MKKLRDYLLRSPWRAICFRACKLSVGCTISILLAYELGLSNSSTAGIITVLSIQGTKVDTLKTAGQRLLAFLLSILLAGLCYSQLGFTTLAFGLFLFLFIFICRSLMWENAVSMNAVLVTHFLTEQSMSWEMVLNETLLFAIGVGMGVLMNLHLKQDKTAVRNSLYSMDEEIRKVLRQMSGLLIHDDRDRVSWDCFHRLEQQILAAEEAAWQNHQNTLRNRLRSTSPKIRYVQMRRDQCEILSEMYKHIGRITVTPVQAAQISSFLIRIEEEYYEKDDVKKLLYELEQMFDSMRAQKLPVTREEFESRAVLYVFMHNIQEFLELKQEFVRIREETDRG